jgi:hypothetical protein
MEMKVVVIIRMYGTHSKRVVIGSPGIEVAPFNNYISDNLSSKTISGTLQVRPFIPASLKYFTNRGAS